MSVNRRRGAVREYDRARESVAKIRGGGARLRLGVRGEDHRWYAGAGRRLSSAGVSAARLCFPVPSGPDREQGVNPFSQRLGALLVNSGMIVQPGCLSSLQGFQDGIGGCRRLADPADTQGVRAYQHRRCFTTAGEGDLLAGHHTVDQSSKAGPRLADLHCRGCHAGEVYYICTLLYNKGSADCSEGRGAARIISHSRKTQASGYR